MRTRVMLRCQETTKWNIITISVYGREVKEVNTSSNYQFVLNDDNNC